VDAHAFSHALTLRLPKEQNALGGDEEVHVFGSNSGEPELQDKLPWMLLQTHLRLPHQLVLRCQPIVQLPSWRISTSSRQLISSFRDPGPNSIGLLAKG
jgi:hypothetical protein